MTHAHVVQMAHEQLVSSAQGLREQGRACPTELMRTLMLLHSYILVKTLVRMGDHQVPTLTKHYLPSRSPPPPQVSLINSLVVSFAKHMGVSHSDNLIIMHA